jgi:hypothetical protein
MTTPTPCLLTLPADEYHAASRRGHFMSSHLLAHFRDSPALYHKTVSGEVPDVESPALALGRAAHCLILEGRQAFDDAYVVADGPVNSRTGEAYGRSTKAYAEWLASQDRDVLSGRDYGFLLKLQTGVWQHAVASDLLSEGVAEGVIRADYCDVACQVRLDWFSPKHGLVDLKTCDSLKYFENDCRRYGYVHQLAFYRAVIRRASGETVPVHIIAVEKNEPYAAGVWKLSDDVLDQAEFINEAALERYVAALELDCWPTGYENVRLIDSI